MTDDKKNNRWMIAVTGTFLQLCLGTVYAWSFFQKPLCETYQWSNSQVAWAFSTAICFLGLAAAWGGRNLEKYGPRRLAMVGSLCFGSGYLTGAYALSIHSLALLYIGYGVIGGCGLGLCYVTPVATSVKWFPDRRGFVSGMVVMGFGFGALLMSKLLAPCLMQLTDGNMVQVFASLGVIFLLLTTAAASFLKDPPAGYIPEGWNQQTHGEVSREKPAGKNVLPVTTYLRSRNFIVMWVIFFCNITAGIAIIGFQSPMLQELYLKNDVRFEKFAEIKKKGDTATEKEKKNLENMTGQLAAYGATLIAVTSLFNGLGRFFWGGLSDRIGRMRAFRWLMVTQILVFIVSAKIGNTVLFGISLCYILLCYGGGFGTMPSFVGNVFGVRAMPEVYGFMLTAWSAAGVTGPKIMAFILDSYPKGSLMYSIYIITAILSAGVLVSFFIENKE